MPIELWIVVGLLGWIALDAVFVVIVVLFGRARERRIRALAATVSDGAELEGGRGPPGRRTPAREPRLPSPTHGSRRSIRRRLIR
jgi:hypothetical protein